MQYSSTVYNLICDMKIYSNEKFARIAAKMWVFNKPTIVYTSFEFNYAEF